MHISVRPASICRLAAAASLVWLSGFGSAWAGGGGEDLGSVQDLLNGACAAVLPPQVPCPQLPTISQGILEIAGLLNARPEAIRAAAGVTGAAVYAGNTLAPTPPESAQVPLSSLTPLAFLGAPTSRGQATPTQLYDPKANNFFYAVTTLGPVTLQPQTLNLSFDDLLRTVPVFIKGQNVGKISLPLAVLKPDGAGGTTEFPVCGAQGCPASIATLQITATCTGGPKCLTGMVTGDFTGTGTQATYPAAQVGVTVSAAFGRSPISSQPHATFSVQVPLLVTMANDPPYFGLSPITGQATFSSDQTGAPAPVLGAGFSVGIPPYAAPPCLGAACPSTTPPAPPPPTTFGFCASFSNNSTGPVARPAPAVAAFVQIGTDGETLASAALPSPDSVPPLCPF